MINEVRDDAEKRMKKAVETLTNDFIKIRTGRATASFLDHVQVDYYGTPTFINQIANITVADSRTLLVTPWEKPMVAPIEKAILTSDLGLNPATSGNSIRVPMPPLNEERRKEMIKIVRAEAEQSRVSVRNIRRDSNNQFKDLVKDKLISEDEERRANESIQKLTDKYIENIESILTTKEKELLEV